MVMGVAAEGGAVKLSTYVIVFACLLVAGCSSAETKVATPPASATSTSSNESGDSSASPTVAVPENKVSDRDIAREFRTVGVIVTDYTNIAQDETGEITRALYDRVLSELQGVERGVRDWHQFANSLTADELEVPARLKAVEEYSEGLDAWLEQQLLGAEIWDSCLEEEETDPNPLGVAGCIVLGIDFDAEQRIFTDYLEALTSLAEDVGLV